MKTNKRNFIKLSLGGLALGLIQKANGKVCSPLTAAQPEGPFYPERDQADKDNDLTQVRGKAEKAKGEVIFIRGVVEDENCQPLSGALVEVWQACYSGKYHHSADPSEAPLDHNFQYWGRAITNDLGEYSFKTIMPGAYPAAPGWIRPSHIHCRIQKRGYHELITQMYFRGSEHLEQDRLFLSISEEERESVLVDLKTISGESERSGVFDIRLKQVK